MKAIDLQHFMPPVGTTIVHELTRAERKRIGLKRMAVHIAESFRAGECVRVKYHGTTYRIKCVTGNSYEVRVPASTWIEGHEFDRRDFIEFLFNNFDSCTLLRIDKLIRKERLAEHAMKTKLKVEAYRMTAKTLASMIVPLSHI